MELSSSMKLKLGPFWFQTSISLIKVVPCGPRNTTYVLRINRPGVCGGDIELPIGRRGFLITLLSRSEKDRRKLRFTLRYGVKGKKLRFLAPSAEVYDHWLTVLCTAFKGIGSQVKLVRHETISTLHESTAGFSDSGNDSNSDLQNALFVNKEDDGSTCGQRGSEQLDASAALFKSFCQSGVFNTAATSQVAWAKKDATRDDCSSHESSVEGPVESPFALSVRVLPSDKDMKTIRGQQKVFCVAIGHDGTAIFSVYVPPQETPARTEMLFKLSLDQWAQWMGRDLRDGDRVPEVYRLTSDSCNQLELSEVQSIVQPYFS